MGQSTTSAKNLNKIGGPCDGCQVMYIGMPKEIKAVDTSVGWFEVGQKLWITGKVLKNDGKTPAAGVIVYYYHTDNAGRYPIKNGMDEQVKLHGYIRGWVKTDEGGNYSIYTIVPGHYPERNSPAHIHVLIKEPSMDHEYYIDDLVFDDDRILTSDMRRTMKNRGGNGVLRVVHKDSLQIAEHDIILGLNVPGYPKSNKELLKSGLEVGEESPSFMPFHVWGADKGTRNCPLCKYGRHLGILYFVGNLPNWNEIKKWLLFLEQESVERKEFLKVFFVYGNKLGFSKENRSNELEAIGKELNLQKVALTFLPSMMDASSEVNLYKINPDVENTFIIYRHRKIVAKQINLKPGAENFQLMSTILDKVASPFYDLPGTKHDN